MQAGTYYEVQTKGGRGTCAAYYARALCLSVLDNAVILGGSRWTWPKPMEPGKLVSFEDIVLLREIEYARSYRD